MSLGKGGRLILTAGVGALLGAILLAALWRHHSWQRWAAAERGTLAPYPTVIVREGEIIHTPIPELDVPLVEDTMKGRWIIGLSRSDYRFSLLGRRAWVKLHLVSARNSRDPLEIQLLGTLRRTSPGWRVEQVDVLAMP